MEIVKNAETEDNAETSAALSEDNEGEDTEVCDDEESKAVEKEAEIYRDAGMRLIKDSYIFMERDYSLELYE